MSENKIGGDTPKTERGMIVFTHGDKVLCETSEKGYTFGEAEETRKLLANENSIKPEEIKENQFLLTNV